MSNRSKDKALSLDSASLRESLKDFDQSFDFDAESKKDNHNLKRFTKEQLKKAIPVIMTISLIVLCIFVICFIVMLIRYLSLIWEEPQKISTLLFGTLKVFGAYVFGVLTPALFKNKK